MNEDLWWVKVDEAGGNSAATRGEVQAAFGGGHPATGTQSLQAATLGPSGGVVAGLSFSGGLGVALPCASAKRSRLLP